MNMEHFGVSFTSIWNYWDSHAFIFREFMRSAVSWQLGWFWGLCKYGKISQHIPEGACESCDSYGSPPHQWKENLSTLEPQKLPHFTGSF